MTPSHVPNPQDVGANEADPAIQVKPDHYQNSGAHQAPSLITARGSRRRRSRSQWFAVVLTIVAAAPLIAVIISSAWHRYLPAGDGALIDLRVRDVWSGGLEGVPLVGAYSKFGWNHPGPAMFWAISPLSLVAVGAAWGTLVGAALLQGAALLLTARLAWRRGGFGLLAAVLALEGLTFALLGSAALLDPWNPYVAVSFFPLFILLCWSTGIGEHVCLLGVAIVGSFLVQTHIGYALLVGAGFLWVAVMALVDCRSVKVLWRRSRGIILLSVAAGAVMWLPAVVDQLVGHPGNLTKLWEYFTSGHALAGSTALPGAPTASTGVVRAMGIVAAEFVVPPPWLGGNEPVNSFTGESTPVSTLWLLVPAALVVLGYVAARRSAQQDRARLISLVAVLNIVGIVTISQTKGGADPYLFYWRSTLAMFVIVAAGWAIFGWLNAVRPTRIVGYLGGGALITCVGVTSVAMSWAVVTTGTPYLAVEPTIHKLVADLQDRGLPRRAVLMRLPDFHGVGFGVFDELDRRGVSVRVDPKYAYLFGKQRTAKRSDVHSLWYVVEGQQADLMTKNGGGEVIARTTPLTSKEDQELARLQAQLRTELEDAGRTDLIPSLDQDIAPLVVGAIANVDKDTVARVGQLNSKVKRSGRCRCSIIAYSPRARAAANGR